MLIDCLREIDCLNPNPPEWVEERIGGILRTMSWFWDTQDGGFWYEVAGDATPRDLGKHVEENSIAVCVLSTLPEDCRVGVLPDFGGLHTVVVKIWSQFSPTGGFAPRFAPDFSQILPPDGQGAKLDDFSLACLKLYSSTANGVYLDWAAECISLTERLCGEKAINDALVLAGPQKNRKGELSWASVKHLLVLMECHLILRSGVLHRGLMSAIQNDERLSGGPEAILGKLAHRIFNGFVALYDQIGHSGLGFSRKAVLSFDTDHPTALSQVLEYKAYGNAILGYAIVRFLSTVSADRDYERTLETYLSDILNLLCNELWDSRHGGYHRQITSATRGRLNQDSPKYVIANTTICLFLSEYLRWKFGKHGETSTDTHGPAQSEQILRQLDVVLHRLLAAPPCAPETLGPDWAAPSYPLTTDDNLLRGRGAEQEDKPCAGTPAESDHDKPTTTESFGLDPHKSVTLRLHPQYLRVAAALAYQRLAAEAPEWLSTTRRRIGVLMNNRIFLSYKGADRHKVQEFKETLKLIGLHPWMDEDDLKAGDNLHRSILQGFEESCAAVFFVTPNFRDEKYLKAEIEYALQQVDAKGDGFRVIVLRLAGADGKRGEIPKILHRYIWKEPNSDLEAIRELIKAQPLSIGTIGWK